MSKHNTQQGKHQDIITTAHKHQNIISIKSCTIISCLLFVEVFVFANDSVAMPKSKHSKALKFNPVIGGTQLAFRGGWSNAAAAVTSLHVGEYMFVLADISGGFGQLVFGRKKLTAEDSAKIRCIAGLQQEIRCSVDDGPVGLVVADAPVETDWMGDAQVARGLEGAPKPGMSSRGERRERAAKKVALREKSLEGRVVSVRFPKYPGRTDVGAVNVICMLEPRGQRPKGVWIRREDFPWLVTFAAMEVASADGEELFPPNPIAVATADARASLKYSVGGHTWDLTWLNTGTGEIHHLSKRVPRRRYGPGGRVMVIPPQEFLAVKRRTMQELWREAKQRGYDGEGGDTHHPESP